MLHKFKDDIKMGGIANTAGDSIKIHDDLNRLKKGIQTYKTNFSKGKCQFLYLHKKNLTHKYKLVDR